MINGFNALVEVIVLLFSVMSGLDELKFNSEGYERR